MTTESLTITTKEIDSCRFSNWYDNFKSVTLPSIIIELSPQVVDYLLADGIVLPLTKDGNPESFYEVDPYDQEHNLSSDDHEIVEFKMHGRENESSEEEEEEIPAPSFPDLEESVVEAIKELGGVVFPKLNWSSPKDACWMSLDGTLKCRTVNDILLLMKSSDFIVYDLTMAYEHCIDFQSSDNEKYPTQNTDDHVKDPNQYNNSGFELVLRKWHELSPSMEFRCFVKDNQLIGISQRDINNYYSFLEEMKEPLITKITTFFKSRIQNKFQCKNYTFDIYINKHNLKVWLLDFNPFHFKTDSLLFEWQDLIHDHQQEQQNSLKFVQPEFRIVHDQQEADYRLKNQPAFTTNRLPKDVFDFGQDFKTMTEFSDLFHQHHIRNQVDDGHDEVQDGPN